MKNFAAILSILSIVITPCLAQGGGDIAVGAVDEAVCVNETTFLSMNQAVQEAYDAMAAALEADLTANATQFCDIFNQKCTIDVGEYSASLKTTCEAQGGQLVEREMNATCSGTVSSFPITDFEIALEGAPLCAGASCDPTAIPAEIEAGLETVLDDIVAGVNLAFMGNLVCDVAIGSGGGGGGSGGGNVEETPVPSGDGGEIDTTPAPGGDDSAPTPSEPAPTPSEPAPAPTSGAQATTIWVSAAGLTLVSSIWM